MNKLEQLLIRTLQLLSKGRRVILSLSVVVVFITTYILILPAFTLEKDEAAKQGGIDVPGIENVSEDSVEDGDVTAVEESSQIEKSSETPNTEVKDDHSDDNVASSNPDNKGSKMQLNYPDGNDEVMSESSVREKLQYKGKGFTISVDDSYSVLPENTEIAVEELLDNPIEGTKAERKVMEKAYEEYCDQAITAINEDSKEKTTKTISFAKLYDISLISAGEEITPDKPISVTVSYDNESSEELKVNDPDNIHIVHFAEDKKTGDVTAELLDTEAVDVSLDKSRMTETSFEAESFSVYGVVYTVDFHYSVNGEKYDFNLNGGGSTSIRELVDILQLYKNVDKDISSSLGSYLTAQTFVQDVEKVVFSDDSLVRVVQINEDIAAGDLKKELGFEPNYSDELTEEDIAKLDEKIFTAPDWALFSLEPFDTEEALTITMKNGDVFTIVVTDSQDPYGLDGQEFEIVVNGSKALSPVLETETISGTDYTFLNDATPSSGSNLAWKFEYDAEAFGDNGDGYFISHEGQYLKIVGDNSTDTGRTVTLVNSKEEATPIAVTYDRGKGKYSFSNDSNSAKGFLYHFNNDYFGVEGNSNSDNAWFELRDPDHWETPGLVSPWDVKSDNIRIKLFDYSGTVYGEDIDKSYGDRYSADTWHNSSGINNGRTLIFSGGGLDSNADSNYNKYTGRTPAVMQGIVKNKLPENGYPELTGSIGTKGPSLDYLFGGGGQDGVTAYTGSDGNGLKGLLRRDENGYYYYSSEQNYASLNEDQDEILLYSESYDKDNPSDNARKIGFFPFDPYRAGESKAGEEKGFNGSPYNHQFGMTMEADFVLPPDGKLKNGDDMVFTFSGDDDVWVFIDDVLVLDLGGVHQPLSGEINFADGKSYVTDASIQSIPGQTTVGNGKTIKELFTAAGKEYDDSPYSTHTIKFFYLERGGCDSNCTLSFNLDVVKGKGSVEVAKYDKDSNPVAPLEGVKFGLYADPECSELMKEFTSDGSGIISFIDLPVKEDDQKYYLKETKELAGYEANETIYTLEAVKLETGKYKFKVLKDGVEIETIGQNPEYPVIYNEQVEPITLTVEKQWQNPEGETISPPWDASATFKVQRYFRKEGDIVIPDTSQPVTFKVYRYKDNNTPIQVGEIYTLKGGTNVKVNWGYSDGYLNYDYNDRYNTYKYNTTSGNYSKKNGNDPLELTLPQSGTANLYIRDENVNTQWGAGVINVTVDGTPYAPKDTIEHISTDWAVDSEFNNSSSCPTISLPENKIDADHPWTGKFENLITEETKNDGLGYYYKYYIIETEKTPSESQTVYVDGDNNVITDPSTLQTNTSGNQTVINQVPVGNLQVTKDLLGDVTGNEDKEFKVTIKNNANPPKYLQDDRKSFDDTPYQFTVSKSSPLLIEGLPIGTYIINESTEENDVAISGYLWNVEESVTSGTPVIIDGQTTTVALKNYYDEIYTPEPSNMDVKENLNVKKIWENLNNREPSDEDEILFKVRVKSADAYVPVKWDLYDGSGEKNDLSDVWYVESGSKVGFSVTRSGSGDYRRIRLNSNVTLYSENGTPLSNFNDRIPSINSGSHSWNPNPNPFIYYAQNVTADKPVEYLLQPAHQSGRWIADVPSSQGQWNMNVSVQNGNHYTSVTDMRDALVDDEATVETLVYRLKKDQEPELVTAQSSSNIRPESVTGEGWNISLKGLPTYQRISSVQNGVTTYSYKVYSYEIEEIVVNGKAVVDGKTDDYQVHYATSSATGDDDLVTTTTDITNTELSVDVKLLKTDDEEDSNNYLAGAVFELQYRQKLTDSWVLASPERIKELNVQSQFTIPGDANGITLTGLQSGYYQLVEISPPADYVIIDDTPVQFEVRSGAIVSTDGTIDKVTYRAATSASGSNPAVPDTFKIPNTYAAELPMSGGIGTTIFYILGSLLVIAGGIYFVARRRLMNH